MRELSLSVSAPRHFIGLMTDDTINCYDQIAMVSAGLQLSAFLPLQSEELQLLLFQ